MGSKRKLHSPSQFQGLKPKWSACCAHRKPESKKRPGIPPGRFCLQCFAAHCQAIIKRFWLVVKWGLTPPTKTRSSPRPAQVAIVLVATSLTALLSHQVSLLCTRVSYGCVLLPALTGVTHNSNLSTNRLTPSNLLDQPCHSA